MIIFLFIDASEGYTKDGNKNKLKQKHIDKIIDTYRNRETIDKFSYVADLDEVKENDYNLNIPRYVDTFEEEEPVDLDSVSTELKQIETELDEVDNEIADYCQQLDISTPF